MPKVRCHRCGIETFELTAWPDSPRCGNCDAVLPNPGRRRFAPPPPEPGEEPGLDASAALGSEPESG